MTLNPVSTVFYINLVYLQGRVGKKDKNIENIEFLRFRGVSVRKSHLLEDKLLLIESVRPHPLLEEKRRWY